MITRTVPRPHPSAGLLLMGIIFLFLTFSGESAMASGEHSRMLLRMIEPLSVEKKVTQEPKDSSSSSPPSSDNILTVARLTVGSGPEVCTVSGPCELCTDSDRESISECMDTGRRQVFVCSRQESDDTSASNRTVYRSCKRTVDDEVFLLVRFQVFCFLTGTFAFMSVRKQKAAAASLFDQRKLNLQAKRRTTCEPAHNMPTNGVEMTSLATTSTNRQSEESRALLSSDNDGLDVV